MELINQAFCHVEVIRPHVLAGHYDLIGPCGEIILPGVWEAVVEPGWAISMYMWPMPDPPRMAPRIICTSKSKRRSRRSLGLAS